MAVMTDEPVGARAAERAGAVVRLAGAAVSVALCVGVAVWGYRLFVRDVTGIPVVQAMQGPMREAPANPGGQIALHTGLAVNAVAALGEAAPPEDTLMLAPSTAGLAPEDMEVQALAETEEVLAGDPDAPVVAAPAAQGTVPVAALSETPMTAAEVLALADLIAAGAEPLAPLAEEPIAAAEAEPAQAPADADATDVSDVLAAVAAETPAVARIPADVPGVAVAYRPPARPGSIAAIAPAQATASTASAEVITATDIAPGTPLVQLGAYQTAEIAAADWTTLSQRFAEFMGGKARVIQPAESGGEPFFRLRAAGFTDMDDANRFCAVLVAEGARCTPVLME
jgi:hypothetical protein